MAERERERVDGRAVALGALRFGIAFPIVFAGAYVFGLALGPVLRDFNGQLPLPQPGPRFAGAVAAVVGLGLGWAHMRANRRIAGRAGADYEPGASALARARDRLADDRGPGLAATAPVQRWDQRLLAGGDPVSDPGRS